MDFPTSNQPSEYQFPGLPGFEITDGLAVLVALALSLFLVFLLTPPLIRKMRQGGMVGIDINKSERIAIPELGGIAALFAFSVSLSVVVGLQKILGTIAEPPFLAAISVFFMASMIGLIDDISNLKQRLKAVVVAFAALPLLLVHLGPEVIDFPFGYELSFLGPLYFVYWLLLVPAGVTGVANGMNMSAGYNGLESGQIAIVSLSLLVITSLRGAPEFALLIFACILGSSAGLYYFNRFPARIFIGDIGTLGLGAAIAAGVILGHVELYGLIAIVPAFYEGFATLYFGLKGMNGERRKACHNPVKGPNGFLSPPPGASRYTLAFWILSHRPMTEKRLVLTLLGLYAVSGAVAIILSLV